MAGFKVGDSSVYMTHPTRTDAYKKVRLNASTRSDSHYNTPAKIGGRDVFMSADHFKGYKSLQGLGYEAKVHNQDDTDNPMHGLAALFRYVGGTYPRD